MASRGIAKGERRKGEEEGREEEGRKGEEQEKKNEGGKEIGDKEEEHQIFRKHTLKTEGETWTPLTWLGCPLVARVRLEFHPGLVGGRKEG